MVAGGEIARIVERNRGTVSRAELRGIGLSDTEIRGLIRSGILHILFRGVYAYGNPIVQDIPYLRGALSSCPPGSFITGDAGDFVYGFRRLYRGKIDVVIPRAGGRKNRGNLTIHCTRRVDPLDVTTRNDIRVASFPRLFIDRAHTGTPEALERLLENAVRREMFDPLAIEAALIRHARMPGVALARGAAVRYRPGPDRKSDLERSFDRWHRTRPDIPDCLRNVTLLGWEVDCVWPEQRVVLELDGRPYHVAVRDFDKDSLKSSELLVDGWKPLRVTDFRWEYDRVRVVAHLESLLGL